MTTIDNIAPGGPSRAAGKSRRVAAGSTFHVDDTAAADHAFFSDAPSGMAAVGGATLDSLLTMQESAGAKAADATAIQQGCSVLNLLTQLQRAALAGHGLGDRGLGSTTGGSPGRSIGDAAGEITDALGRHIGMMETMAAAGNPRLRGLMAAIRLRGQIEIVRRTRAGS